MDAVTGAARHVAYPVVEGGEVVGVLPFTAVLRTPRTEWDERLVGECMLRLDEVPVMAPDDEALVALGELSAGNLHRALVLEHGRLAGLISITDIGRVLAMPRGADRAPLAITAAFVQVAVARRAAPAIDPPPQHPLLRPEHDHEEACGAGGTERRREMKAVAHSHSVTDRRLRHIRRNPDRRCGISATPAPGGRPQPGRRTEWRIVASLPG